MHIKPYIKKLKTYLAKKLPDYYDCEAHSVMGMVYIHYTEFNRMDTAEIKKKFEELYRHMNGLPLRGMDRIIDTVCTLCDDHEKVGFGSGIKVGSQLVREQTGE